MLPDASNLFDPAALVIVLAGTVLATVARCGWREFGAALRCAGRMLRSGFAADANRKALALAAGAIRRDGPRRADPALPPDRALALMVETYLRHGSLEAMAQVRRAERALGEARRVGAAQVFGWAGELAPVFGLIGTLYGFTQLTPDPGAASTVTIMNAISTAVLTSLYGALTAHLVCFPLAGAIERRGLAEERARETLAEWFTAQLSAIETAGAQSRSTHLRGVA